MDGLGSGIGACSSQRSPWLQRATIGAALVFLDINGAEVPEATEALYAAMLDVAAHRLDKSGLADVLRRLAAG